jgi:dTDP-4-amino-4,6-dideoxygalactose transaminase
MIRSEFLPLARPHIGDEELSAVADIIRSGWWTTGPKVQEFEQKFAEFLKEDEALLVTALNSCSSGMFLTLKALGIGPGDEVIVPTWTFAATAQVVEWTGATPVLCDIEGLSLGINVDEAEKRISSRTKAIIAVHIGGYPCNLDGISALAEKFNLSVIEDAAHAIGTKYKQTKIGNFSDATCFSFYATKNLAMGEGGAVVSKDEKLKNKIEKLAYFGINKQAFRRYTKAGKWRYDIEQLGYKFNLDSIHAALGLAQLSKIDSFNTRRRHIAHTYKRHLDKAITYTEDLNTHYHTFHLFQILLPEKLNRDDFIQELNQVNIGTSVHFLPLHQHSYYRNRQPGVAFPTADRIFERIISIPMFPAMTDEDVEYVIYHINQIIRRLS